jgi:hypothetical protein
MVSQSPNAAVKELLSAGHKLLEGDNAGGSPNGPEDLEPSAEDDDAVDADAMAMLNSLTEKLAMLEANTGVCERLLTFVSKLSWTLSLAEELDAENLSLTIEFECERCRTPPPRVCVPRPNLLSPDPVTLGWNTKLRAFALKRRSTF